jgi:lysophospholipase L1-like esterase
MADKPLADNPERGWGQMLPLFFDYDVKIFNHARNGRSTKSFIDEGRWKKVYDDLKSGDYVFIQFGHNDSKISDPNRYADPHTDFKNNLVTMINDSKEKGAFPVLITPVHRRNFDKNNKIIDKHGDYSSVVREIAASMNVGLIDLHKKSEKLFNDLGPEKTKKIFLWISAGKYEAFPDGKEDNTHFTQLGSYEIASLVVNGLKELDLPITKNFRTAERFNKSEQKVIGLDYHFNNEWRKDDQGVETRYHYIWEDTTNSGFYELGKMLTYFNTQLTSLTEAPTNNSLSKLDMYIMVDPDTPSETKSPNYIDNNSIKAITEWVKDGGILVLMANDSANSEFENLNKLAAEFGIHFNEDSKHRVTGRNFDMGMINKFPDHPIFKDVGSIYVKEISTLSLKGDAEPILFSDDMIVMAGCEYGSGYVFAIGDPWLYNEYFDNRKLPEKFHNFIAAENLFLWLLNKSN